MSAWVHEIVRWMHVVRGVGLVLTVGISLYISQRANAVLKKHLKREAK
jgi:hypothetical protein